MVKRSKQLRCSMGLHLDQVVHEPLPPPDLCRALENSKVLILYFSAEDLLTELYAKLGIVELVERNKALHHVVMSVSGYPIHRTVYKGWVDEIVDLSITLRRPITYFMVNCSLPFSQHICEIWKGVYCQLIPDVCDDLPIPTISFKGPADPTANFYRIDLALKELSLPYSNKQLVWLQQCRRLMAEAEDSEFIPVLDGRHISEHRLGQIIASFTAGNYNRNQSQHPSEVNVCWIGMLEFEQLAVMISLFARMIATGKLALPPPPEFVPLCSVHSDTVVCACDSLATPDDPYKLLRTHVVSSARRQPGRTGKIKNQSNWLVNEKNLDTCYNNTQYT